MFKLGHARTAFVLATLLPVPALGADAGVLDTLKSGKLPPIPGDWTVTLGVEGRAQPVFEGSKDLDITPAPVFSLRRMGKPARFRTIRDGGGIAVINTQGFYFGPVGKFRQARKESDDDALRGLGDVDWTLEVGVFAEYWPVEWLRTRAEVRRGFNGHEGIVADLSADLVVPFAERWLLSGGPRMTWADTKATAPYFGIDGVQSLASGLPMFDAQGGVRSVGAGAQATYQWTPQWTTRAFIEYDRLMGDAASSPLVTERGSKDQFKFGLGLAYSFDIKLW